MKTCTLYSERSNKDGARLHVLYIQREVTKMGQGWGCFPVTTFSKLTVIVWDFPGGPMVRTPCMLPLQGGHGFDSWSGN